MTDQFTPSNNVVSLDKDDIDEQILYYANDMSGLNISENEITDDIRQQFIDIYWNLMLNGISMGEDWYGNQLIKQTCDLFK